MRPEAQDGCQLDLSSFQYSVSNNFSIERSKQLNETRSSTLPKESYEPAPSKQTKGSPKQKAYTNVSSKFTDVSKFHSQRLLNANPSLNSIIYDPKGRSRNDDGTRPIETSSSVDNDKSLIVETGENGTKRKGSFNQEAEDFTIDFSIMPRKGVHTKSSNLLNLRHYESSEGVGVPRVY